MEPDVDALFVRVAQDMGFLTREQVEQCERDLAVIRDKGARISLRKLVLDKGLVRASQLEQVQGRMRRQGIHPRIGGYEIIERLGTGAMGTVYKARQVSLDRMVALKVLKPALARDSRYLKRFRREARLAGKLAHPNAVQVYDFGEDKGAHYIAMEFVAGRSLAGILEEGPIREEAALRMARGIAQALEAAHEKGIVHRDVKPSNILVSETGVPRIADLGIAKRTSAEETVLTAAGVVFGTAAYMSPEQCMGRKHIDGRSDIYSLGVTLFHMVCGRPPFEADSNIALMNMHVHEPLPDPRRFGPGLSDATRALIQGMCEKRPKDRPRDCRELVRLIDETLARSGPLTTAVPSKAGDQRPGGLSPRMWVFSSLVVAATAIAAAAGVYYVIRWIARTVSRLF